MVHGLSDHPAGFYYLLQDARGGVLAGNLPAIDPRDGVREWSQAHGPRHSPFSAIRGRGLSVPGGYLFVGWSTHQLNEMEEMVVRSFAWGLAASIALALAGGWVMGSRLMRRIETVSNTSRNIVGEDLQQRLPVTHPGDELDHLAASINTMLDRIQTLMEDLRQVTTDIAHDLRTPLTRLRQRLELASALVGDPDVDAIYVGTPHPMHHDITVGTPVPVAATVAGGRLARRAAWAMRSFTSASCWAPLERSTGPWRRIMGNTCWKGSTDRCRCRVNANC